MPAYNAEAFISAAIVSVQDQTHSNWELIIVDDASTDSTTEVVKLHQKADSRIRLISLPTNGGAAVARNAALDAASGDWIAILDADDTYLPNRLTDMLSIAAAENLDILADNLLIKDPGTGQLIRTALPQKSVKRELTLLSLFQNNLPASGFVYGLFKPIIRRDFIESLDIRYQPILRFGQDFVFYAEILIHGARGRITSTPMYIYTLPMSESRNYISSSSRTPMKTDILNMGFDYILENYCAIMTKQQKHALSKSRHFVKYRDDAARLKQYYISGNYVFAFLLVLRIPFLLIFVFKGLRWRFGAMLHNKIGKT
jgi:succinoglycan biosynthesis protein ExoO